MTYYDFLVLSTVVVLLGLGSEATKVRFILWIEITCIHRNLQFAITQYVSYVIYVH